MTSNLVDVIELAGWGLDENVERGMSPGLLEKQTATAEAIVTAMRAYEPRPALLDKETAIVAPLFEPHLSRDDLARECRGLCWELGVVDLHRLLAFQRRVRLSASHDASAAETRSRYEQDDWRSLLALAFPKRISDYSVTCAAYNREAIVRSLNPDFAVEVQCEPEIVPTHLSLRIYHGSPFIEVGEYRGRWFLRDGYHRAYALLQSGIHRVPAVIVRARAMEEVAPARTWFFNEQTLFSPRPPMLTDFHDRGLTLDYRQPMREKVIRITLDESFQEHEGVAL